MDYTDSDRWLAVLTTLLLEQASRRGVAKNLIYDSETYDHARIVLLQNISIHSTHLCVQAPHTHTHTHTDSAALLF